MPAPSLRGVGATTSGVGAISVPWGTHGAGDVGYLMVQTANEPVAAPSGWEELPNSPQGIGTAGAAGSVALQVFAKRATSGAEANAEVADAGDHEVAFIMSIQGCPTNVPMWVVTSGDTATSATAVSVPGFLTTAPNCWCLDITANATDTAVSQQFTDRANTSLSTVSNETAGNAVDGVGGGIAVGSGLAASERVVTATTGNLPTASAQARMMVAISDSFPTVAPLPIPLATDDDDSSDLQDYYPMGWFGDIRPITWFYADWPSFSSGPQNYTLTAEAGSYTLSGQAAALKFGHKLAADAGSYALTGSAAGTRHGWRLDAQAGAYTLSGEAAGVRATRLLNAAAGSYALSGQAAGLVKGYALIAAAGSYLLTGEPVTFSRTYRIAAEGGSYVLSGQSASLRRGLRLAADAGSYTLSGQNASLLRGYEVAADAGSYILSGQTAAFRRGYRLAADAGSYTLSGQNASLLRGLKLVAAAGAYVLTGNAADLIYTPGGGTHYTLNAETGIYLLTGSAAGLRAGRRVTADAGSYTLSGQSAGLRAARVMQAQGGSYLLGEQDAGLRTARRLAADGGVYLISGSAADLILARILPAIIEVALIDPTVFARLADDGALVILVDAAQRGVVVEPDVIAELTDRIIRALRS